jgi:hypothetical protein
MKKIKILLTTIMVLMSVMGCAVKNTSETASTNTPAEPQVSASATWTAAPPSTSTPQPTFTPTPLPAWIAEFAEPILESISSHQPDYEDNFSSPGTGWQVGPIPQDSRDADWGLGSSGYLDDEYYIETLPAHNNAVAWPVLPNMSDLVVEMDVRSLSVDSGAFQVHFRHGDTNRAGKWHGYLVEIRNNNGGEIVIVHYIQDEIIDLGTEKIQHNCREFCRLLIVAHGPEIAVYLNGKPVLHAFDEEFEQYKGPGGFNLVSANGADKTTQVIHIDNFRLWDISNLP